MKIIGAMLVFFVSFSFGIYAGKCEQKRVDEAEAFLSLFDWKKLVFFLLAFLGMKKFKWHPVAYIAIAAVVGMIFKF